jgi:integrase
VTSAPEPDPYQLALPGPSTPVVIDRWVKTLHAHLNSRYEDAVWALAPLNDTPSSVRKKIAWRRCPTVFQDEMRLAAWNLINGELRPTFVSRNSTQMRGRISAHVIYSSVSLWFHLAKWLEQREITSLVQCDTSVLDIYIAERISEVKHRTRGRSYLMAITRLWALDQISARPCGIGEPPWEDKGQDEYVPAPASGGENLTEPLSEYSVAPLLIWALRMVDDLSDDILAAWFERQRLLAAIPERSDPAGLHVARSYLDELLESPDRSLPARRWKNGVAIAESYICGRLGVSRYQVHNYPRKHELVATAVARELACPLEVMVQGRIAGKPWRTSIDYHEAPTLYRHLGTAAFIVCAYLTGMRPGEVLGLHTGCCPEPEPDDDGNVGRHVIHGRQFKYAIDEDGYHRSEGTEREVPWVAVGPVVQAIRVLERMVGSAGLLFSSYEHDVTRPRSHTGSLLPSSVNDRIQEFVAWVNQEAIRTGLHHESIPPDPAGKINAGRFRRTLAWHIARRPNGHIALAIQYGHIRTVVSEGYAARGRNGIHDLVDIETVLATAETAAELQDSLARDGGISGPAAREVLKIVPRAAAFSGTTITARTARKLLDNNDLTLYDNPNAFLLCNYKPDRALCRRGEIARTPKLEACVRSCLNIARTDKHATEMRHRADVLELQACHSPEPIGDRLRANAQALRSNADVHDSTRIVPNCESEEREEN